MRYQRILSAGLFCFCLCAVGIAQAPNQTVQWSGGVSSKTTAKQGGMVDVDLSAVVQDGWHVYALTQAPGGPTPLRIALDANEGFEIDGVPSGTVPVKAHDPSMDLDTQFYPRSFVLHVPVQVKLHASVGKQTIPVNVHFQSCTDRTCSPPRTVHLSVPIEVLPGS